MHSTPGKLYIHPTPKGRKPLRFIQMWFIPAADSLPPRYGGMIGDAAGRKNQLSHLVSDVEDAAATPVKLRQDVNMYAAELEPAVSVEFALVSQATVFVARCDQCVRVGEGTTIDGSNVSPHLPACKVARGPPERTQSLLVGTGVGTRTLTIYCRS